MSTEFSKPIITAETDRPIPLAGQGYPYNSIASDRRFEELIYSIYKKKIEHDHIWKTLYDDISLMQGVREKGRDCVLYKNKVITGIIQCKKYGDRISKPDCVKEILKFVLYSFFDSSVLPDASNLTYYFVVSEGFSGPASDYLDKFKDKIVKESELENWFNELKTKYKASLGTLDYATIRADLLKKLTEIKVCKVASQDLDLELAAPYTKEIVSIFFEVRTATDNSLVQELKTLIETKLVALQDIDISNASILKQFETASLQLSSYRDHLHNLQDSHLERTETTEIINWIERPLKPKDDCLLIVAGNPGYGKTVILKDVLKLLLNKNVPAIAIKADRYYAETIYELTEKLNLEHPLVKLVQKLKQTHVKVVVIIDQIDSLSQSITSRRDYIDTYNQLIHQLKQIDGIRIIISIRTFDLNYDYEFSSYKDREKVIVKPLSEKQVKSILGKLSIATSKLSAGFISLLAVPNHLDIFCKIYGPRLQISQLHSLQDLYNELWQQKITSHSGEKAEQLKTTMYELSEKMYKLQQLSISETQLTDSTKPHLQYLISNGLLAESNKSIQFFHQTFHDYVFARSFVEKGESLQSFITREQQSIFIRPAVKMILAFVRQKDNARYVELTADFLFSQNLRFHLQLLIINQLGFEPNPSKAEVDFVKKRILPSGKYRLPFLESAIGSSWLSILIETRMLDQLLYPPPTLKERITRNSAVQAISKKLKVTNLIAPTLYAERKEKFLNLWYWILRRLLPENRYEVVKYLNTLPQSEERDSMILRLLNSLKKWDHPLAFTLFESCTTNPEKIWFDILNILEDSLDFDYDWSVRQIDRFMSIEADRVEGGNSPMYNHKMENCLKKMFNLAPGKSFNYALENIKKLVAANVEKIGISTDEFYYDGIYDLYNFDRDHAHNTKELLLQLTLDTVVMLAKENSRVFQTFVENNKEQNSVIILKILLIGLDSAPKENRQSIFELLMRFLDKKGYDYDLQYWIGKLISAVYIFLEPEQKSELNTILLNLKSKYDFYVREDKSKTTFFSYYGKTRFELMSMIPEGEIIKVPELKRHFQELQRKYGKAENRKPLSARLMRIGPPLEAKAYEKMDIAQWENSFLKFDTDSRPNFGSDRGGLTENYRQFEAKVPDNVHFFLPLIEKIIKEKKVVPDYMLAGLKGLTEAKYDPEKFLLLFKEMTKMPLEGFHVRQLVWLTDYIIKNKLVDEETVTYLCRVATRDPDPAKAINPHNPEFDTLNSNRGAAVHALIKCFTYKEFGNLIFAALEQTVADPIISVRISALHDLAVLMNIDKERTLALFLKFTSNMDDHHVFMASINSAQYLARYNFEALKPYFEKGIKIEKVQDQLAIILAISWLNDKPGSYDLLERVWKSTTKAQANMVDIAIRNYIGAEAEVKEKCRLLYKKFLQTESKDTIHQYNTAFLHMSPLHFQDYLPLLKEYSGSRAAVLEPHYFFDYLIKCSKSNPVEVLDLLKNYRKYQEPNVSTGPYYSPEDPVKALIGAYNGLYDHSPVNKIYATKALNLFDEMLQQQLYRTEAQKVLDVI